MGTDEIERKWDGVLVHCKLMALDELNHIPKECCKYTPYYSCDNDRAGVGT